MSPDLSSAVNDLDRWIRGEFTALNTELEEIYFAEKAIILGACRRHEVEPDQSQFAPLAQALGSSLGVAPRFSSAHQHIHNRAAGRHRDATTRPLALDPVNPM